MWENLETVWTWFDPSAATVGAMSVIAWWLTGLVMGWVFDVLRKS